MNAGRLSGGEVLAKALKKEGVKYIFGVPGGQLLPFMEAVSKEEGMAVITTRHEENGAHMADSLARLTGAVGVCFGTVGPGATNMLPGVAAAYGDGIPVLAITANNQNFCTYPFHGSFQDLDHQKLYSAVTKWNAVVHEWERIPELVHTAFRVALSGRPGPVHLDIPADIMFKTSALEALPDPQRYRAQNSRVRADSNLVRDVAQCVSKARRPLLLAGGGVARSEAWEEFSRLLKNTKIPATTTPMAAGVIAPGYEGFIGAGGMLGGDAVIKALREADVVLAIGCRFSTWLGFGQPPIMGYPEQKIVQVDIDPEMIGQHTDIALGVVSDAKLFLQDLLEVMAGEPQPLQMEPSWPTVLAEAYQNYLKRANEVADTPSNPMSQATLAKEVSACIKDDAIIYFDGALAMEWSNTFIRIRNPRQSFFAAGMGHLGFGQPFANAAKLLYPEKQVLNIAGDGAFGCTLQELETAVRYNLAVINIISNDRAWGLAKEIQVALYNHPVGVDFTDAQYADIAKGFGAYGERVEDPKEIKPALARAMKSGKPAVLDVRTKTQGHIIDPYFADVCFKRCELPRCGKE